MNPYHTYDEDSSWPDGLGRVVPGEAAAVHLVASCVYY